jgi:hypothetical protein
LSWFWQTTRAGKKEERGLFRTNPRSPLKKDLVISIELPRPTTVSEVQKHNQAVRRQSADRACYRKFCSRCEQPGPFAPHELRRRGLRLVADHMVLSLTIWLARWRCRKCRYVFTDYPDFRTPL